MNHTGFYVVSLAGSRDDGVMPLPFRIDAGSTSR
jgi:hypothetical protein